MSSHRKWIPLVSLVVMLGALVATARPAEAGNYIVYLHGRSMSGWPTAGLLGAPAGWTHVPMGYDGSASLGNSGVRTVIADTIASRCGAGNQCIIVCYSAGCARMLDAFKLLKDQGRYPANILWSQAAASAAGGSELTTFSTKWWVKLLAVLFNMGGSAPIDNDIQPNVMRNGAYASIQNQATTPVYHQAGSRDICVSKRILFIKIKFCFNTRLPGGHGDGAVPVHSAAGYADTAGHSSTNDGSAKYVFRAYEQTPLYNVDHRGIFGPLVSAGSLRLAVTQVASCPNMPTISPDLPDASIIYEDADGAYHEESSPLNMLAVCGEDMWNGEPPLYATCHSTAGCCTDFSNGSAGGCSCGETLCKQSQVGSRSYYTNDNCTGTEYTEVLNPNALTSFDGLGMVGTANASSIVVRSARTANDGRCQVLMRERRYSGNCPVRTRISKTLGTSRRVYRPAGAPPPPVGSGPGLVVEHVDWGGLCP